ncbi:toll/interleukin-1 receptor domain-containing protein [Sulfuriferula nivalis]|uniref:TIR domain-containing protein n=1 Tax=Sulfuriferula nivalis TaxID=2675298 RepID=A0A809RHJ0_9PROT|nr:toll/interleukin-1 receptor domain-containing protein [Sulfuriferula nivalis]BBP01015.1 hypothetical protein SFSGTM_17230 [Sulfuriferula nivalis]
MDGLDAYVDAKALNAQTEWTMNGSGINQHNIIGKISYAFEEHTKYWSFFVPEGSNIACVEYMLNMPDTAQCIISEDIPIFQIVGDADSPERYALDSFKFSGRIYLYIDEVLKSEHKENIVDIGTRLGFSVVVRDREYVEKCSELARPIVFISHDSRDKDSLVSDLAREMSKLICPVWYDEYSLKVGDSLRENIERGLKEARKCVVILSPNFISNGGWTKAEFDSIYTREIHEKSNVILPVWHNIESSDVYDYCPRLLDRLALSSSIGIEKLAKKLVEAANS